MDYDRFPEDDELEALGIPFRFESLLGDWAPNWTDVPRAGAMLVLWHADDLLRLAWCVDGAEREAQAADLARDDLYFSRAERAGREGFREGEGWTVELRYEHDPHDHREPQGLAGIAATVLIPADGGAPRLLGARITPGSPPVSEALRGRLESQLRESLCRRRGSSSRER